MGFYQPAQVIARVVHLYRTKGMREIVRALRRRAGDSERAYRSAKTIEDRQFDASGYNTGGVQHIYRMTLVSDSAAAAGNHHVAVPPQDFRRALAATGVTFDDFTFIDLGSGKGRALLLAADMPFKRIIGVEFARELHEIAGANIARCLARDRCDRTIEALHGDAAKFQFPDDPIILFLFNPFDPPVLTAVTDNAMTSWRERPRPFRIVYLNPVHSKTMTETGWHNIAAASGYAIFAPPPLGASTAPTSR